ncbi:MAG: 30S ribosome-binding factor RbfA [Anaerolineae bacterium]|nr:30S ribosome-binding factor RbfA [Anaerolineae bacterium]
MGIKQDRIAWRIRQILSELLLREVSDPRLHGVTVTEVDIDRELQFARVYVNALGEEVRQEEVMQGLNHAKGFLRRELGQSLRLRKTPELAFVWDLRFEHGEHLNQVISSLDIPPEPAGDELE